MMNREELAKLYEKANGWSPAAFPITMEELERFAALVEAHVNAKEKERQRYDIHSCGPECDRYICVAVRKAREEEREAIMDEWWMCVQSDLENGVKSLNERAAEKWQKEYPAIAGFDAAIRARGQ